jgi:chromosome segregation ATPase
MEERTMANKLADARRSLIRAQESAQKRLEELENERREIKASLKSLDAALKALGKPNRGQATRRPVVDDDERDSRAGIDAS